MNKNLRFPPSADKRQFDPGHHFRGFCQGMFPNPDHTPALAFEQLADDTVSRHILANLWPPKTRPGFWHPAVAGTAMPKAAVNKNRKFAPPKNKIRFSRQARMAAPASDVVGPEHRRQLQFG
jgi:hypothetical protein